MAPKFKIKRFNELSLDELYESLKLRSIVFVVEQNCVYLDIDSKDQKAWHVLGKWYFEVSSLNFVEKAAIKIIYGGLPDASFEKAVQAYEKAAALSSHFLLNFLELAKAYEKLDQKSKAVSCLIKIKEDNTFTEDDLFIKKQAEELLQQWQ